MFEKTYRLMVTDFCFLGGWVCKIEIMEFLKYIDCQILKINVFENQFFKINFLKSIFENQFLVNFALEPPSTILLRIYQ